MPQPAIMVSSAAPDTLNSNSYINQYVAAGFRAASPEVSARVEPFDQLEEKVLLHRPDFVLLLASCLPAETHYSRLRHACDKVGARIGFWLLDDPYEFDANVKAIAFADVIFVSDLWSSWHYLAPFPVHHLPLAASPEVHFRAVESRSGPDVFFCGVAFDNRNRLLTDLHPILMRLETTVLGSGWNTGAFPFARNLRIGNDTMASCYNAARLVLNVGRRLNLANATTNLAPSTPGPRTFEAAMAGAAQVYFVDGLEIEDYFTPDEEILLFDTPADFERIVERMRDEPDFSLRVGRNAQKRCLAEHTYEDRARRMLEALGFVAEPVGD